MGCHPYLTMYASRSVLLGCAFMDIDIPGFCLRRLASVKVNDFNEPKYFLPL